MLCLVRQPNAVTLEVEVDPKAKGKQCLDKVCQMLGIIETDYVGLQYTGPHGEKLWLNLRNELRRQLSGPSPYRLHLRVKFLVPPHLVLQDVTRHLFYLDIRQDFTEGLLRATSEQVARLCALVAQAEIGDVDLSNRASAIMSYPKWLPQDTDDQTKPCVRVRWHSGGSNEAAEDALPIITPEESVPCCSSSSNEGSSATDSPDQISIETDRSKVIKMCRLVLREHAKLCGTKVQVAEYLFLQEAAKLEDFGLELYFVKTSSGHFLRVGVGPLGIVFHDLDHILKHSIPYPSIQMASHSGRCFYLSYVSDKGELQSLDFKLENCHSASALYRAVTEKHAFYSCETVRNAITSQFIRDLKGTIASIFNENTALGKNYVFDIQRTCREVYDHTRRVMFQVEADVCQGETANETSVFDSSKKCQLSTCKNVQEQLASFQDSVLCRVCMDADVSTVFFPCRHIVCCNVCSTTCKVCPLCRSDIEDTQQVYLPFFCQQLSIENPS